ncbi:hypothetical protein OGAPHI_006549 [Ogataea philodendri]|uniref:Uncharacterized protein n=1 Tax=Ogataea philodendri TaxID=1378263 RepID=A0A9P8T105_9ASCO|nr:uncharacterized protein OGAPHI_006549 [Ogataea philodendri]KAH3661699.1 hypothetical protein OGAPHI_006549 [Ogataea philodendri]
MLAHSPSLAFSWAIMVIGGNLSLNPDEIPAWRLLSFTADCLWDISWDCASLRKENVQNERSCEADCRKCDLESAKLMQLGGAEWPPRDRRCLGGETTLELDERAGSKTYSFRLLSAPIENEPTPLPTAKMSSAGAHSTHVIPSTNSSELYTNLDDLTLKISKCDVVATTTLLTYVGGWTISTISPFNELTLISP